MRFWLPRFFALPFGRVSCRSREPGRGQAAQLAQGLFRESVAWQLDVERDLITWKKSCIQSWGQGLLVPKNEMSNSLVRKDFPARSCLGPSYCCTCSALGSSWCPGPWRYSGEHQMTQLRRGPGFCLVILFSSLFCIMGKRGPVARSPGHENSFRCACCAHVECVCAPGGEENARNIGRFCFRRWTAANTFCLLPSFPCPGTSTYARSHILSLQGNCSPLC